MGRMLDLRISRLFNRRNTVGHDAALGFVAGVLAVAVFYVDTFTSTRIAIAVLYVIVLLLAGDIMTRAGILAIACLCGALTLFSYFYSHGVDSDISALSRMVVSIAALSITAALLLRSEAFRAELIGKNAALRESEARYRAIFNEARVALWERDYTMVRAHLMNLKAAAVEDLRDYLRSNPEEIVRCIGFIRTVAANEGARELLGPKACEPGAGRNFIVPDNSFIDQLVAIFCGDTHFESKGNVTTDAGETKLVLISIRFPEDDDAFHRVVVGMIDITQRELTQQALVEARAELTRASRAATAGALSASLAHELNQPLGAIVVNSRTLLRWLDRDPPDLAAVHRSAERMIRDSQRASDIIQNTRSMLSQTERPAEWIDLEKLVEETHALMEHEFQRSAIFFETIAGADLQAVNAVRLELQQVLINLMTNAMQAMADCRHHPRRIELTLERKDEHSVCISIRDNGPGIPEEAIAKLFTPFYTTKASGMGMGLTICRSMLEAKGGRLDGFNHPEGGAVFEIILPIEDDNV
ncbi:GHKL domain-containing protein [Rhizobium sp. P32RR-XVIII]|nr:GHKL domain-containing protein [Rhizobium sp. P32RR-XVIII]